MSPRRAPPPPPAPPGPECAGRTNRALAERLSRAAAKTDGHLRRAFRRAARAAFGWPEEAADLHADGRSLEELRAIGPFLARALRGWIEAEPEPPEDPPPLRRGFLTRVEARRVLASDPAIEAAVRADLQAHTTWSDGLASVEEMAEAALALGRETLAITDHSKGLAIANGMDEARLRLQRDEIDAVDARLRPRGLRLLRSMEVNLSPTGEVDMDPAALLELDLVLGAFHSALRRTEDQTERYLAALRNPSVHVLAHPRCRVYDHRAGLSADWARVCAEAARLDKAIEVDAFPDRQDLDVATLSHARAEGCRVSIGSDAHHPADLAHLDLAVAAVSLAGIPPERVVSTMSADSLLSWVASLRESGPTRRAVARRAPRSSPRAPEPRRAASKRGPRTPRRRTS